MVESAKKAYKERDFKKAEQLYTVYLKSNPSHAESYYQRGMCKLHSENILGCLEDFKIALSLEPNNPYRHSTLAFIHSKLGNTEQAIRAYQKAIDLDPDDAIALNNLGLLEEKKGNITKAKRLYDHADLKMGISKVKDNTLPQKKENNKGNLTKARIIKNVFTDKNTFKEFTQFIKGLFS